ncbi:hypothetical protein SAMN05216327_10912 [Dyadobacter sp. SG02]|nr:hypothetical protein SAMN05216327_10912 [Dyadobacter sp. SG02]
MTRGSMINRAIKINAGAPTGLSVGFPGLEKSGVTPFEYAQRSISCERSAAADKFTAIITLNPFGETAFHQANLC